MASAAIWSAVNRMYLRRLISDRDHVHNLRSATTSLSQSSSRTTLAKRAFRCSSPSLWNSLPRTVINSDSIAVFKSKLKTFLFSRAYSLPLLTPTSTLPDQAPLKLRPYGAIQISILLLLLLCGPESVRRSVLTLLMKRPLKAGEERAQYLENRGKFTQISCVWASIIWVERYVSVLSTGGLGDAVWWDRSCGADRRASDQRDCHVSIVCQVGSVASWPADQTQPVV